jgi:transposase
MGRPAGWMKQLTGREAMRSQGAPSLRREVERQFWVQIATGITSERAAESVGVSQAVGSRWFRHRGGMPLFMSKPVSGRYLSFAEREEIGLLRAQDVSVREIARRIGRSPSTVSRELTRNAATRGGKLEYRASVAQWKSELVVDGCRVEAFRHAAPVLPAQHLAVNCCWVSWMRKPQDPGVGFSICTAPPAHGELMSNCLRTCLPGAKINDYRPF